MLTEKSQNLSKFIVNSGLLMEHIDQLCKMKDSSTVSQYKGYHQTYCVNVKKAYFSDTIIIGTLMVLMLLKYNK